MADEHDDLLNFEIGDNDYADGTLNEDELLLSDEENIDEHREVKRHAAQKKPSPVPVSEPEPEIVEPEPEPTPEPETPVESPPQSQEEEAKEEPAQALEEKAPTPPPEQEELDDNVVELQHKDEEFSDIQSEHSEAPSLPERPTPPQQQQKQPQQQQHQQPPPSGPHGGFRPQFRGQRFPPRGMPRWMGPGPAPFPGGRPMMGGPQHPQQLRMPPNMRPGPYPPQRGPGFFMQQRPPPHMPQRFFYPNAPPPQPVPSPAGYVPTPIVPPPAQPPVMPRKVLINPNFKGGVEAVKSQLLKDFSSSSAASSSGASLAPMSEDELQRQQQMFINSNIRTIEKRRYERSPSPGYRRSYSHSPSPPRFNNRRRPPFKRYERRRSADIGKPKDENQPEEDEETRAYREKIETQRKQREELIRQKEMRRRQLMEAKVKETEPLKPLVVTEKKIILTKKPRLDEKSTTPPIDEAPLPASLMSGRKILIKPKEEMKIGIAGSEKRKLQKIIKAEN